MFLARFHPNPFRAISNCSNSWLYSYLFWSFPLQWTSHRHWFLDQGSWEAIHLYSKNKFCALKAILELLMHHLSKRPFQASNKAKKSKFALQLFIFATLSKNFFFPKTFNCIYASNGVCSFSVAFLILETFKLKVGTFYPSLVGIGL